MQCLPIFFLEFAITHAMTSDCSTLLNYATNEKSFVVLDNIRSIFLRTLIHIRMNCFEHTVFANSPLH